MGKYLAILSGNDIGSTITWFHEKNKEQIDQIRYQYRKIIMKNSDVYVIVTKPEDIYGYQFFEYVKAPNYVTLEDIIRVRLVK